MPVTENRSPVELRSALNPHQVPATVSPAGSGWPFEVINGSPGYTNLLDATHAWALARELDECTGLPAAVSFKHVNPSGAAVALPAGPGGAVVVPAAAGDVGTGDSGTGDAAERETAALGVTGLELSPLALAYARARGANRAASYGDFVAVSRPVDGPTAALLKREVSDGIIAPGFEPGALAVLSAKKSGRYLVLTASPDFTPPDEETRTEGGLVLRQRRDTLGAAEVLGRARLADGADGASAPDQHGVPDQHGAPDQASVPDREGAAGHLGRAVRTDLLVAITAAKWTVSNAVVLAAGGQVIGVGAGQQSRVEATRIACGKAETWWLRRHPAVRHLPLRPGLSRPERDNAIDGYLGLSEMGETERRSWLTAFTSAPESLSGDERSAWLARLDGVAMASDGLIPFRDNIDRAARTGVRYVIHGGGSVRDGQVAAAAREHGVTLLVSGCRQFLH